MHPFLEGLSEHQRASIDSLVDLFLKENAITNLSALRSKEACFTGNVLDSLAFTLFMKKAENASLIDIGTGGGFPLLPIAISYPTIRCTGLDAVGKKVKAVERMAKALNLQNVEVIAERTEGVGRSIKHRERYDIVTARAVAPLPVLLEYCSPFVKVGGSLVVWKSLHIDEELQQSALAASTFGLQKGESIEYELPLDFGRRQLLIYKKTSQTSAIYPRRIGEAKQHPITEKKSVE